MVFAVIGYLFAICCGHKTRAKERTHELVSHGGSMKRALRRMSLLLWVLFLVCALPASTPAYAQNDVMGELQFEGKSHVEKTSGVWVDGQYVGYLNELKGSKKVLLLPGEHVITVRQDGYRDFTEKITVRPGQKQTISVKMLKDPQFRMPSVFSEI